MAKMIRTQARVFAWLLLGFVTLVTLAEGQTPAIDSQSLVGQWSGQWENPSNRQFNGQYHLTIQKVEGNKVFGKAEFTGNRIPWYNWEGKFESNVLSFSDKDLPTELTVTGDSMNGWVQGRQARVSISISKRK